MSKKNSQKSLVTRRNRMVSHRKAKIGMGLIFRYLFSGVGDRIYYLGMMVERRFKNYCRHVRHAIARIGRACLKGILAGLRYVGRYLAGVWRDLAGPFKKMRRSFKSLMIVIKSTEGRGRRFAFDRVRLFFKYGWLWNKHLVARMLNYVVPVAALVACAVVMSSMLRLNYALEIVYGGQVVGYVTDENVYESARKLIQSRMVNGDSSGIWTGEISMSIAIVDSRELATDEVLARQLVEASGSKIVEAMGVYIGGRFYGATAAPDLIKNELEVLKEPAYATASLMNDPDINVKFAREVEFQLGIFPTESIVPFDKLMETITSSYVMQQILYFAQAGEFPSDIAAKNGLSLEKLMALNEGIDFPYEVPFSGDVTLVVAENEPLLRIKIFKQVTETRVVPYDTITIRDDTQSTNTVIPLKPGVPGKEIVTLEKEYKDGREISSVVIARQVTEQPQNREILVGTKNSGQGSGVGGSTLLWPVGRGFQFVSRGYRVWQSHYAIDFACQVGTEIYAAADGKIIAAGYGGELGWYIHMQHPNGLQTQYAHCSELIRAAGDIVKRGDVIAYSGNTGKSTGPHLHFAVSIGDVNSYATRVDPAELLGRPDLVGV